MTDERAKKILDFLARRTGYEKFIIDDVYDYQNNGLIRFIASCVFYEPDYTNIMHLFFKKDNHYSWMTISKKDSYAEILEMMLKIVNDDKQGIETLDKTFLPKNTSLEQLEIEMDLDSHDRE